MEKKLSIDEIIERDIGYCVDIDGVCSIKKDVRFYADLLNEMAELKAKKPEMALTNMEEDRLSYLEIETANGRILSAMSNDLGSILYGILKPATIKWVINSDLSSYLIHCIYKGMSELLNADEMSDEMNHSILGSGLNRQDIYDIYERLLFLKNVNNNEKNQMGVHMIKAGRIETIKKLIKEEVANGFLLDAYSRVDNKDIRLAVVENCTTELYILWRLERDTDDDVSEEARLMLNIVEQAMHQVFDEETQIMNKINRQHYHEIISGFNMGLFKSRKDAEDCFFFTDEAYKRAFRDINSKLIPI